MKISSAPINISKASEIVNNTIKIPKMITIPGDEVGATDLQIDSTKRSCKLAINKMNKFMDHIHHNSKFVFHEELDKYYIEVVDAKTQEVIKEIPPKVLLDAYYKMQKLAGKLFDKEV